MQNELKKLGLSDSEIKVYLTLLSINESSVSVLSYRCDMSRNACRYICHQLIDKKLVINKKKGNTFIFKAEPPEKLYYLIDQEERKIQRKKDCLNRVMGELKAIGDPESLIPITKYAIGIDEVAEAHRKFFKNISENSTIYSFVNTVGEEKYNLRERIINIDVSERTKKNIHIKCISSLSPGAIKLKAKDTNSNRETILVEKTNDLPYEIMISERAVIETYTTEKNTYSITTLNQHIALMRIENFKLMWKGALTENKYRKVNHHQYQE